MNYRYDGQGLTSEAVDFYFKNKGKMMEIIQAKMTGNVGSVTYELTLLDIQGNVMKFPSGLSAGYRGEGPSGTLEILRDAGFDINEDFITSNVSFSIWKGHKYG